MGAVVHCWGKPTAGQPRGFARTGGATRAKASSLQEKCDQVPMCVLTLGWVRFFVEGCALYTSRRRGLALRITARYNGSYE
jgi:hypothetical protein